MSAPPLMSLAGVLAMVQDLSGGHPAYLLTVDDAQQYLQRERRSNKEAFTLSDTMLNKMFLDADEDRLGFLTPPQVAVRVNGPGYYQFMWRMLLQYVWGTRPAHGLHVHPSLVADQESAMLTLETAFRERMDGPPESAAKQLTACAGDLHALVKQCIAMVSPVVGSPTAGSLHARRLQLKQVAAPPGTATGSPVALKAQPPLLRAEEAPFRRPTSDRDIPKPYGWKEQQRRQTMAMRAESTRLQHAVDAERSDNKQLTTQSLKLKTRVQKLEEQLRYVSATLDRERNAAQVKEQDNAKHVARLQGHLDDLQASLQEKEEHRLRLLEKVRELQQSLGRSEEEAQATRCRLNELRPKLEAERALRRSENQQHDVHTIEKAKEVSDLQQNVEELTAVVGQKDEHLGETQRAHEAGLQRFKALNRDLMNVAQEVISAMEGPPAEGQLRKKAAGMLKHTTMDTSMLLEWVNCMLWAGGSHQQLDDFQGGPDTLTLYLRLLSIVAPRFLPQGDCTKALSAGPEDRAAALMDALKKSGMPPYITEAELMQRHTEAQHILMVAYLFQRFCDPSQAAVHGKPPLLGEYAKHGYVTPDELRHKYRIAREECHRWRKVGDMAMWHAMGQCVDLLRSSTDSRNQSQSLLDAAQQLKKDGMNAQALEKYDKALGINTALALEIGSWVAQAYSERGQLKVDMKNIEGAMKDFNKAIEVDEHHGDAFRCRADLRQFKLGLFEEAIEDYSRAIHLSCRNASTYCNRGECYSKLKRYEPAFSDFEQALKLDPALPQARDGRATLIPIVEQYQRVHAQKAIDGLPRVQFEKDGQGLEANSDACLDTLPVVLAKHSLVALRIVVSLQGKQQHKGELTFKRAQTCQQYLLAKGVEPERMEIENRSGGQGGVTFEVVQRVGQ